MYDDTAMRRLARLARVAHAALAVLPALAALPACAPREAPPPPPPPPQIAPPPPAPPPPAGPVLPPERPPLGQLPPGVRPLRYALALQLVPAQDRFAGTVEILVELTQPRSLIWMHARDLTARGASVRPEGQGPIPARLDQVDPTGVAALTLERPAGPGRAIIRIDYDGPLPESGVGLYRVRRGGRAYAFTQFEATSARTAFPGFDEPAFKVPFQVTLFVPKGEAAIANSAEIERVSVTADLDRVTFAPTPPIPTYLTAFAVGPLEVVSTDPVPPNAARPRPLPLRGVATAGRGRELSWTLANTGALVTALEDYTGIPYPYDKLDVIAVPEKRGAMENPGAVTFGESHLLIDPARAPAEQRRKFLGIAAHELAHMWFGDLVTMPWWNDLWLKEASATWLGARAVHATHPDVDAQTQLLAGVHWAMDSDGQVSARKVRQEIREHHDISNAFDGITYQKGSGVISMFERWLGPEVYQRGLRSFLQGHPHGTAGADDYLAALSRAAGRDVATPMRTFLDQPGVPLVEARLSCGAKPVLELKQSRYLPLGSAGDPSALWQIPICARYAEDRKGGSIKESCALLVAREGALPLEGDRCPAWVLPNADGAGYYRWSLPAAQLAELAASGLPKLSVRERMSFAASVRASFAQGGISGADALEALAPLAADPRREVATEPMELLQPALDWLADDPARAAAEAYARRLYAPLYRELGWSSTPQKKGSAGAPRADGDPHADGDARADDNRGMLRGAVIRFLALAARDPEVRKEAAARGRAWIAGGQLHPEAVLPDLAGAALASAMQEGDAALFDEALAALARTDDELARGALLFGLGSARAPELAARARELALDPRVQIKEIWGVLDAQLSQPETREAAWQWLEQRLDALIARMTPQRSGGLPWMAASFCDRAHADRASALFGPRVAQLDGGPRNLAGALEAVNLCAARKKAQVDSLRGFFSAGGKPRSRRIR